ncbi:CILiary localization [Ditylenchus destructor]|nr:CILiary localization [Ditylenchus destructor]
MGGCASSLRDKSSHLVNSFILIHRSAPNGTSDSIEKIASAKINLKPKKEVAQIELTETVVQEYVALEKAIYKLERSNVVKKHESKMIFADDIKKSVDQLEATYKELKKQTEKERVDVENIEQPSVKSFLMQQGTWQQRFDKEQQEYLDCLNKQEVAEKELKNAQMQYDRASKISDIYKRQCDTLNELHDKQDNMLLGIFGPEYASTKENQLEAELDDALEWQQRISLAKFKWTNGRVLLVHASTQMAFGN